METLLKNDGSPNPTVQGKDGETAGNKSEQHVKNLCKYPALCRTCTKQFEKFRSEGHPDDGREFACGMMVEAMDAGVPVLSCTHRAVKIAPIIDAESPMQKALLAARNPREALLQIQGMAREARQDIRNQHYGCAFVKLNEIYLLSGGLA